MYRIASSDPADRRTIEKLAPGSFQLRGAAGICIDIKRHLSGTPGIVTDDGFDVPGEDWLPEILAARKPV